MDTPTTAADVRDKYFEDIPEGVSDVRLQTWLDVAWRALQGEDPTLVARIESGAQDTQTVIDVIIAATLRVLRNAAGLEGEDFAVDDYRESRKYTDATQDVYFTAAEKRRLGITDDEDRLVCTSRLTCMLRDGIA